MHNDKVMALLLKVLETLKNAPKENHTKKVKVEFTAFLSMGREHINSYIIN